MGQPIAEWVLRSQEHPYGSAESKWFFRADTKPTVVTKAASEIFTNQQILEAVLYLKEVANEHGGLDYLQVFDRDRDVLWVIEGQDVITALLPGDY